MENLVERGPKGSKVWYYRAVHNGRQIWRSTGFKVGAPDAKSDARLFVAKLDAELREKGAGASYRKRKVPTFGSWADEVITARYGEGTNDQRALIRRAQKRWSAKLLTDIRTLDIQAYFRVREAGYADHDKQSASPAAQSTLERERVLLKTIFQVAMTEGLITRNPISMPGDKDPATTIRRFQSEGRERVMSHDEEAKLRAVLNPSWNRYLTVGLGTGLRSKEQRSFAPCHIVDGWLNVQPEWNKRNKPRRVPLSAAVLATLADQRASMPAEVQADPTIPYWCSNQPMKGYVAVPGAPRPWHPISEGTAYSALVVANRKVKITEPMITIHDLRRTFASRAARANMHPKVLQKILGHVRIEMTMRFYVHVDEADIMNGIAALFPPPAGDQK